MTYGLPQIAAMRLLSQPLLLSADAVALFSGVAGLAGVARKSGTQVIAPRAMFADREFPKPDSLISRHRSLAVVKVAGPMMHEPDELMRLFFGASCYAQIAQAIRESSQLAQSGQVDGVVLRLDTPGGTTTGISETIDAIDTARAQGVRVIALVNEMACSGGQWIASRCDATVATPSAVLGSVGVMQAVLDASVRYEREGLRLVVMRTGSLKAAGGYEGEPFTADHQDYHQEAIENILEPFVASVAKHARMSEQAVRALQGRTLTARQAERIGLCELVPSARAGLDEIADELANEPG